MVFRFIIRYLANNEHLVNKLADSYPVRRAARLVVYFANRTKSLIESEIASGKLKDVNLYSMKNLAEKLENQLKQIKQEIEKKGKN